MCSSVVQWLRIFAIHASRSPQIGTYRPRRGSCLIRFFRFRSVVGCLFPALYPSIAFSIRMNRYGENGHPCLIPIACVMYSEVSCGVSTLNYGLLQTWPISLSILGGTEYLSSVQIIRSWLTCSDAFSQSGSTMYCVCPVFPLCLVSFW